MLTAPPSFNNFSSQQQTNFARPPPQMQHHLPQQYQSNQHFNDSYYHHHNPNPNHYQPHYSHHPSYQNHPQQQRYVANNYQNQGHYDPRYQHFYNHKLNQNPSLHNPHQSYNYQNNSTNRNNLNQYSYNLDHQIKTVSHQNNVPVNISKKPALIKQIVYQQQPLNIPQSVRNVQYVPQLNRYMDYVQQRVKVPVEKYYTDYYEIQHITDFVPRQYQDTVIEMVPEEVIRYRLQYVPVQKKIVHIPKKVVYDQNGLFKGVGNLADRVHIDQAAVNLVSEGQINNQSEINKALYQNMANSQLSRQNIRNLEESLVKGVGRQIQGINRSDSNIDRMVYEKLKGNVNQGASQSINENLYKNLSGMVGNANLPQNQMINQQIAQSISRNVPSRSRFNQSRKRTNYITSDGYFPNYQQELKNIQSYSQPRQYFNDQHAMNSATRMQGNKAAYNLGQALMGSFNQGQSKSSYEYY